VVGNYALGVVDSEARGHRQHRLDSLFGQLVVVVGVILVAQVELVEGLLWAQYLRQGVELNRYKVGRPFGRLGPFHLIHLY
jgi:hypothetical protein